MRKRWFTDTVAASAAGYLATLAMERATTVMYERQPESVRERENELRKEMPTTTLVRKVAEAMGANLGDDRAGKLGGWVHNAFGTMGGPATALLARRGLGALSAGLAVGLAMWVFVDEGANAVFGLTPPATEFPLATHGRALAGHVAYGVAVGTLVGLAQRAFD